jgi:opacity protein-like surface antigen
MLCCVTLSASALPVLAQTDAGVAYHVGITGSAAMPVGDLSDLAKTGWNAGALLTVGARHSPLSFRLDGQWQQLGGKGFLSSSTSNAFAADVLVSHQYDVRLIDATANAVYTFVAARPTSVYLISGIGVYNERTKDAFNDASPLSSTKFGLNAGVGLRFRLNHVSAFAEARYHNIFHGSGFQAICGGHLAVVQPGTCGAPMRSWQLVPITLGLVF